MQIRRFVICCLHSFMEHWKKLEYMISMRFTAHPACGTSGNSFGSADLSKPTIQTFYYPSFASITIWIAEFIGKTINCTLCTKSILDVSEFMKHIYLIYAENYKTLVFKNFLV